MQLSESILPYDEKTFILVADRLRAKFYLADKTNFTLIQELINDRMEVGDSERYASNVGGGARLAISQDEQLKEREAQTFYKQLAGILFERKQHSEYQKLILVISHEDKNVLTDELHTTVRESLELTIPKELIKTPDDQLVKIIDGARR